MIIFLVFMHQRQLPAVNQKAGLYGVQPEPRALGIPNSQGQGAVSHPVISVWIFEISEIMGDQCFYLNFLGITFILSPQGQLFRALCVLLPTQNGLPFLSGSPRPPPTQPALLVLLSLALFWGIFLSSFSFLFPFNVVFLFAFSFFPPFDFLAFVFVFPFSFVFGFLLWWW